MKVFFCSRDKEYRDPTGGVECGKPVLFSVKTDEKIKSINFLICEDKCPLISYNMVLKGICDGLYIYQIEYIPQKSDLFYYYFMFENDDGIFYLNLDDGGNGTVSETSGSLWRLTVYESGFTTPEWFKGGIMYHIFVDRFYDGGVHKGSVRGRKYRSFDWSSIPEYKTDSFGNLDNCSFFGGDLRGVIKKLDYLKSLNVTCIYLSPIFEAASNHKYDTADFTQIDPNFGSYEDFTELCSKAGEMGIRIILDGVFNHTGSDSVYFNKNQRYTVPGAYQSKESPYYDWFNFTDWPDEYECWWNIKILPNLNKTNPDCLEYFINGEDSIVKRWLKSGAGGWRLDVADELSDEFIFALRKACREIKSDALIIGEVWEDATTKVSHDIRRKYLYGKGLDSVMNYVWKDEIIKFIKGSSSSELYESIENIIEHYPPPAVDALMNLLGTHDTERILTTLVAPKAETLTRRARAEYHLSSERRKKGVSLLKLASLIQFTLPGVPSVFYGDEAGIEGYGDPFCRRGYPWGDENDELTAWYKLISDIRKNNSAIRFGEYYSLRPKTDSPSDIFAFERRFNGQSAIIIINRSNLSVDCTFDTNTPDSKLTGLISGKNYLIKSNSLLVTFPPLSCDVLGRQ